MLKAKKLTGWSMGIILYAKTTKTILQNFGQLAFFWFLLFEEKRKET